MKAWITAGLVALLATLLAVSTAAAAKPRHLEFPGGHSLGFSLRGSNGFKVSVETSAGTTQVIASKGDSWVAYVPRGRSAWRDRIDARLPGVGRVAVQFQPIGKAHRVAVFPGCKGRPGYKQPGVFVGTIRLTGERGFTAASSQRVRGTSTRTFDEVCPRGREDNQEPTVLDLNAATRHGRTEVLFSATSFESATSPFWSETTIFSALARTVRPGMTAMRSTLFSPDKERGFTIANPVTLESATVDPPGPFAGTAAYGLNPDGSASWTGSLSAELPGMGTVSLAGPRFDAQLCRGKRCTGDDPLLAQGSGSHSQALAEVRLSWSR